MADLWRNATGHLSSPKQRGRHPAYRQLIAMGRKAVPFILADLRDDRETWFEALGEITGAGPVKDRPTTTEQAKSAWLEWGESEGLI